MPQNEVFVIGENAPDPKRLTALTAALEPGETAAAVVTVLRFQYRGQDFAGATVLVTNRRLLVSKLNTFGRPKVNTEISLGLIAGCGCGPLLGVGPTWVTQFEGEHKAPGVMYLRDPAEAEILKNHILYAVQNYG